MSQKHFVAGFASGLQEEMTKEAGIADTVTSAVMKRLGKLFRSPASKKRKKRKKR